jgi:hypothetical protein
MISLIRSKTALGLIALTLLFLEIAGMKTLMKAISEFLIAMALAVAFSASNLSAQDTGAQANLNSDWRQTAQSSGDGTTWKKVGIGTATAASNVLYIPAKVVYGILGGITGGAGYALTGGNQQVAQTIWRSSLGGDYWITPEVVAGKRQVHFSGLTATAPANISEIHTSASAASAKAGLLRSTASAPNANQAIPATHPIGVGAGPISSSDSDGLRDSNVDTRNRASYSAHKKKTLKLRAPLTNSGIE